MSFGMVPTPVTAFGSRENSCKLSFSVTASHNPPEYSGVKFYNSSGMELARDEEERIEQGMMVGVKTTSLSDGVVRETNALDSYLQALYARFHRVTKGLKIVVDCADGPGALVTPVVLSSLGHRIIPLNAQISSRFPARLPEPTPQSLTDTAAIVSAVGADLGFAHDGDADRLVMIDSAGRVLPDSVVSTMMLDTLEPRPRTVVLSENSSSAVEEEALRLGARVVRSRVGKTFVEIGRQGADFATEPSKVVDPRWGMWEDGMYAAVRISDAIARDRSLLDVLRSPLRWHYKQVNVVHSASVWDISRKAEAEFAKFRISETRTIDGLKIIFKDRSWIMFRVSGTEPKTRIYCESLDELRMEELLEVGRKVVEETSAVGKRQP